MATSASGTRVTARLYMIDRGDELGTAPSLYAGKHLIAEQSIPMSTDSNFMRINLSGQIYAYQGMELRLTVYHDKGSDLDINNIPIPGRATIIFLVGFSLVLFFKYDCCSVRYWNIVYI